MTNFIWKITINLRHPFVEKTAVTVNLKRLKNQQKNSIRVTKNDLNNKKYCDDINYRNSRNYTWRVLKILDKQEPFRPEKSVRSATIYFL